MTDKELTISMYNAYGEAASWTNFSGGAMPQWDDLPERIQGYWQAAAANAKENLFRWNRSDSDE